MQFAVGSIFSASEKYLCLRMNYAAKTTPQIEEASAQGRCDSHQTAGENRLTILRDLAFLITTTRSTRRENQSRSTVVKRTIGRLFNLSLQHRRMHNKLWVADNSVAIVGGRNLGDQYFDAEPNKNFTDIDMLSVGPVAEQLGHSFDQYWNSALSKPIEQFLSTKPTAKDLKNTRTRLDESLEETRKQDHALYQQVSAMQNVSNPDRLLSIAALRDRQQSAHG